MYNDPSGGTPQQGDYSSQWGGGNQQGWQAAQPNNGASQHGGGLLSGSWKSSQNGNPNSQTQFGGDSFQQNGTPSQQLGGWQSSAQQGGYVPQQADGWQSSTSQMGGTPSQQLGGWQPSAQQNGQQAGWAASAGSYTPQQSGHLTYARSGRTGALPPRKSKGSFGWFKDLDRGVKLGLVACVSILLVIVIVGIGILNSSGKPANQTAITPLSTATPTPTLVPTAGITATPTMATTPTATPTDQGTDPNQTNNDPNNNNNNNTTNPNQNNPAPTATPIPTVAPTAAPTATPVPTVAASPSPTATTTCPPPSTNYANHTDEGYEPVPPNSFCFDFDAHAVPTYEIHNPPANFCQVMTYPLPNGNFRCSPEFSTVSSGIIGLCVDDSWARAPTRADTATVCANDGGWEKDLFTHLQAYS